MNPPPSLDPVTVALEGVTVDGTISFSGIDLESGAQVVVEVRWPGRPNSPAVPARMLATGLILTLSVASIDLSA